MMVLLQKTRLKLNQPIDMQGGRFDGDIWIMILLSVIVFGGLIWFVLWWNHQNRFATVPVGEEQIFGRLCDVSELSRSEAYLVRKIVFETKMTNPIEVFTDPSHLAAYAETQKGNKAAFVKNIRNKLFA